MKQTYILKVNGRNETVEADPDTPLLYILRNQLKLNGPKFGCGLQQCGACMVLLNDRAVPSCGIPVESAGDSDITTLEGLSGDDEALHPVQQAFIDAQAAQCGYCLNGMVITSVAMLKENPSPDARVIRQKLQGNICRCGVHSRVLKALDSIPEKQ